MWRLIHVHAVLDGTTSIARLLCALRPVGMAGIALVQTLVRVLNNGKERIVGCQLVCNNASMEVLVSLQIPANVELDGAGMTALCQCARRDSL